MDVLLRYLRQGPGGGSEFLDTAVTVDAISIGSAADSTVQLLGKAVASHHAEIQGSGAGLRIACRGGQRVEINGQRSAGKTLAVGDKVTLGGHQLVVIKPPSGFDVALEIRTDAKVGADEFEAAFVTDLDRTWLSKRKASWALFLLTLIVGLAIPLSMIFLHREGRPTPTLLPDDALWSSGPLTQAHAHAAGNRCDACHQQLFLHVQDPACVECHKTTMDHVSQDHRALTRLGPGQRCGECHAEHLGEAAKVAVQNDQLCVECHASSGTKFGTLKKFDQIEFQQVSGFEPDKHPKFSVALQRLADRTASAGTDPQWVSYRTALHDAQELSNLKFSHQQHLNAEKVPRLAGSGGLGCVDCHVLAADGEHFQPVTMQRACSSCHTLSFDPNAPYRQLPHGKPVDAMLMIEDYFTRKYTDPAPPPTLEQRRRLPDQSSHAGLSVDNDVCTEAKLVCAKNRAAREIEKQFTGSGCVSCHVVVEVKTAESHERYQVTPVRLGYDYFPKAHFPHKSHEIQGKLTGDAACESCHAARKSEKASELLVPDVDNCLQCHRDRAQADVAAVSLVQSAAAAQPDDVGPKKIVTLQCISCHGYHPAALLSDPHATEP